MITIGDFQIGDYYVDSGIIPTVYIGVKCDVKLKNSEIKYTFKNTSLVVNI